MPVWTSRGDPHKHNHNQTHQSGDLGETNHYNLVCQNRNCTTRTWTYSSSPPFLERLLRDLRRLGAAFLLLRLRDLRRRFADFLFGAAFLRDARRLLGAMLDCDVRLLCMRETQPTPTNHHAHHHIPPRSEQNAHDLHATAKIRCNYNQQWLDRVHPAFLLDAIITKKKPYHLLETNQHITLR